MEKEQRAGATSIAHFKIPVVCRLACSDALAVGPNLFDRSNAPNRPAPHSLSRGTVKKHRVGT